MIRRLLGDERYDKSVLKSEAKIRLVRFPDRQSESETEAEGKEKNWGIAFGARLKGGGGFKVGLLGRRGLERGRDCAEEGGRKGWVPAAMSQEAEASRCSVSDSGQQLGRWASAGWWVGGVLKWAGETA
jgi:hypothetical protein